MKISGAEVRGWSICSCAGRMGYDVRKKGKIAYGTSALCGTYHCLL